MSNPWTRNAPVTWPLGPNQGTDNFSSLAAGAAKALGVLSASPTTAPFGDIILPPFQYTLASSPTTGGTIQRFLLMSENNTQWPGNFTPTSTSSQAAALTIALAAYDTFLSAALLLDTTTVQSGTTVYVTDWFSLRGQLRGNLPTYCTILVYNNTSVAFAAFSSNNQVAQYATETYN